MKSALRNLLTAAAIAGFLAAPAAAQTVESAPVETAEPKKEAPALWQVADEDTTIWLFGTIHQLPADKQWYGGPVKEALDASGELVTEIDMTPEAIARIGAQMNAKGTLPEGQTLRGLMSDEQRATYEAGIAKLGLPADAFDRLEPWLASFALLQISLQMSGFDDSNGVEKVLEATISPETRRVALEEVDFQISVFDELPVDQQVAFLIEGAADPLAAAGTLTQLVDVWSAGDSDALGKMMNEALLVHPLLAERMLYSRNADWAKWIDDRLDQPGTVFMAVGAGHLAGEKSVQDLLAARGIETKRVQ